MKLPTQKQIDLGVIAADYFYDLGLHKVLGGIKPTPPNNKIAEIGELYLNGDINSVTATYLVMSLEEI